MPSFLDTTNYQTDGTEFHDTNGICPKVNVIAELEFELAFCNPVFNHYTTKKPYQVV